MLCWSPDDFWSATPYEISCAYVGYCRANGSGQWAVDPDSGWSDRGMKDFRAAIEEMKEQFPDGGKPKLSKAEKRALGANDGG